MVGLKAIIKIMMLLCNIHMDTFTDLHVFRIFRLIGESLNVLFVLSQAHNPREVFHRGL